MTEHNHHESVRLKNFTTFKDTKLAFSRGINAFVGENGTGKTHVLKALYAWQLHQYRERHRQSASAEQLSFAEHDVFRDVFQADDEANLVRLGSGDPRAAVEGKFGGREWSVMLYGEKPRGTLARGEVLIAPQPRRPVFIPAIDMMGHTKGFVTTFDEYRIDFDLTHRDIVSLLLGAERRESSAMADILEILEPKLGGELVRDGERFYLQTKWGRQPMPTVAEGLRKISTLIQLVRNGWLEPGGTLFWDEPEVNVNPILMDEVVRSILELSRRGVQVFLATHSYVILREIEVQATREDRFRLFGFERKEDTIQVHPSDTYLGLRPNPIEMQYTSLYDRNILKQIGEVGPVEPRVD